MKKVVINKVMSGIQKFETKFFLVRGLCPAKTITKS